MSDPCRWSEDGGEATELERELVRAGSAAGPSPREQEQIWLGIAAQCIGPAASAAGGAAVRAKGGLAHLASLKMLAVAALVGGASITGYEAIRPSAPPASAVAPAANKPVLAPAEPDRAGADPVAAAAAPSALPRSAAAARAAAPVADDAKKAGASRLAEESRMVLEARSALRSGDPALALQKLAVAKTAFPDGALTQEREALAIESLGRSGQRDLASRRAAAFLRDYPNSPHAVDVRRYIVQP